MGNDQKLQTTDNFITLEEAVLMTTRYRKMKITVLNPDMSPDVLAICETFDRAGWDALLGQPDCVGVRIYYGMKENNDICSIAVGVNSANEDMIDETGDSIILDKAARCPLECPPKSDLN